MIVTYGGHGGGRCAQQLRQVCQGLHIAPVAIMPELTLSRDLIEDNAGEVDPAVEFNAQAADLSQGFAELAEALTAT